MENKKNIDEIILHVLSGEFTPEEFGKLVDWCGKSAENTAYFNQVKKLWNLSSGVRLSENDVEESLKRFKSHIRSPKKNFSSKRFHSIGYVAAVAAIFLLVFFIIQKKEPVKTTGGEVAEIKQTEYNFNFEGISIILEDGTEVDMESVLHGTADSIPISEGFSASADSIDYSSAGNMKRERRMNTLRVGKGRRYRATLSDGSKVWLNSGSTLTYPVAFDTESRMVSMSGECFFEVAPDAGRPFKVKAGDMDVESLGTSFNITNYGEGEVSSMTLVTGKVRVEAGAQNRIVEPGSRVEFDHQTNTLSEIIVDPADYTGWIRGRYRLSDATFSYLLAKLELWYDVSITDQSGIDNSILFNGNFDNMDIESAVKSLTINTSTTYEYDEANRTFTINKK